MMMNFLLCHSIHHPLVRTPKSTRRWTRDWHPRYRKMRVRCQTWNRWRRNLPRLGKKWRALGDHGGCSPVEHGTSPKPPKMMPRRSSRFDVRTPPPRRLRHAHPRTIRTTFRAFAWLMHAEKCKGGEASTERRSRRSPKYFGPGFGLDSVREISSYGELIKLITKALHLPPQPVSPEAPGALSALRSTPGRPPWSAKAPS